MNVNLFIKTKEKLSAFWCWFKGLFVAHRQISEKRLVFFKIILIVLASSIFLTVFLQTPFFADRGLNNVTLIIWPVVLLLVIIFDYRAFVNGFLKSALFIFPFIFYLLFALIFEVNGFTGDLTKLILFSFILLILGQTISSYLSYKSIQLFMISFVTGSFSFAFILFFTVLIHSDLSNQIYAYDGKNEAAPIFLIASIFLFFIGPKKNVWFTLMRVALTLFFIVVIAFMKCRTILIIMPVVYFILFMRSKPSDWLFITIIFLSVVAIIVVFAVPQIRTVIIDDIIYNNKQNQGIDAVSSGRFTLVYYALMKLKPFLGNGNTYVDCLPVQILCSYGILGTIMLIPFCFYPSYTIHKFKKAHGANDSYYILLLLLIIFAFNSILEGHGHFGPGAKTFIFWILFGCLDFNYMDNKIDVLTTNISNKTKSNHFVIATSSLSIFVLLLLCFVPSTYESISFSIYNRLDKENVTGEYIPVENLEISGPTTMYVGQTINFSSKIYPENATDSSVYWESWKTSVIKADLYSGDITASNTGTAGLFAYCRGRTINSQTTIRVVPEDSYDYSANDFYIKIQNQTEECELLIGQRTKIEYDSGIFANTNSLRFICSEDGSFENISNSIIEIDSGFNLVVKKSGICYIKGIVNNSKSTKESDNIIKVTVKNEIMPVIDRVDLDLPDILYQGIDYSLDPVFYSQDKVIECKDFQISSSDSTTVIKDGKIRFKNASDSIVVRLRPNCSNNDIVLEKRINVLKNNPVSLSISVPKWISVNDYIEIKVFINYENKMSRTAEMSDLVYKSTWVGEHTSGACNDMFHFVSITNGTGTVVYDLKGTAIYKRTKFTIYKLPKKEYYQLANNTISTIIPVISSFIACILSLLNLSNKKRLTKIIKIVAISLCFLPIIPFVFISNITPFYHFYIGLGLSIIALLLFNFLLKRKRYSGLLESDVIFEAKAKIVNEDKFYEIKI